MDRAFITPQTGWPNLHSNNGGGSLAAGRARLSLRLAGRSIPPQTGWPDLHPSNGGGSLACRPARALPASAVRERAVGPARRADYGGNWQFFFLQKSREKAGGARRQKKTGGARRRRWRCRRR